jgi:hypothetical protein
MTRRLAAPAMIAFLVVACAPGTVNPTPSGGGSGLPSATPAVTSPPASPAPSPSAVASGPRFAVVGTEPVIPRWAVPDSDFVLPAAVAVIDGTYHAWVKGFGSEPGEHELYHLGSPDGAAWTVDPPEPLAFPGVDLADPGVVPGSVVLAGERWALYLAGTKSTGGGRTDVWRATANAPGGPWTIEPEPVLGRGSVTDWDGAGLDFPGVLETPDGYLMAYQGLTFDDPNASSIGLATSTDGVTWTRRDGGPILGPGFCGEFDARALAQPRLLRDGDRLLLGYTAFSADIEQPATIGLAESLDDGATWRCVSTQPALDPAGLPNGGVHTFALVERDGRPAALIEWLADNGSDIWLAELQALVP